MRRFAWLLLAVIGTTFVQVQPVEPLVAKPHGCRHCCRIPGSCGMPGCGRAACAPAPVTPAAETARVSVDGMRTSRPARAEEAPRIAVPIAPERRGQPLLAESSAGRAARVPLFKAHCSFLI